MGVVIRVGVLIIAEKPSQAERLSLPFNGKKEKNCFVIPPCQTFPEGAITVWCVGHIVELASAEEYNKDYAEWKLEHLPIFPNFKNTVSPGTRGVFSNIKTFIQSDRVTSIIHCGDPAREGQLLIDEVILMTNIKKKPVKRLWTTSLTSNAVKKAFMQLKDNREYKPLYLEALARQHSDWIVGINFTRCLTNLMLQQESKENSGNSEILRGLGAFSVGRIQTPLLSIIYEREIHMETFKPSKYWDVFAEFEVEGHRYKGKWFNANQEHILFEKQATALCDVIKGKAAIVFSVDNERKEIPPPRFYNLSSLQEEANKRYKYSPKKTLDYAQKLYEKGYLSYPRSSPEVVTEEEAKDFPATLEKLADVPAFQPYIPVPLPNLIGNKRYVDNEGVDDHHAIIITDHIPNLSSLTEMEANIYNMVARRLIAAHYSNASYDRSTIVTVVDDFSFISKGNVLIEEGWRIVIFPSGKDPEENETDSNVSLPPINEKDKGTVNSYEIKEGITKAKSRYTLGSLITVMKHAGNTLETHEREEFKTSDFQLGTEATRAGIIEKIEKQNYIKVKKNQVYLTPKGRMLIQALSSSNGILTSPKMTAEWEMFLKKIGNGEKQYGAFMELTKAMTTKTLQTIIASEKHWEFSEAIEEIESSVSIGKCKLCGSSMIERSDFYGCSAYQTNNCRFSFPKIINNVKIPLKDVKTFFEKGTTSLIKGFKSAKSDRLYDAFITWDDNEKKRKFVFDTSKNKAKS